MWQKLRQNGLPSICVSASHLESVDELNTEYASSKLRD
jgi:hypothetical protein